MSGVIVFTTIFGGSDSLKPAPAGADRCVCFVDDASKHPDPRGWELVERPAPANPRREAWHLRCVPHQLFPAYARVIWIDASFTLTNVPRLLRDAGTAPIAALRHHARATCYQEGKRLVQIGQSDPGSVARQLQTYRRERFRPKSLSISCVIVRDRSAAVERFNETWAEQIRTFPGDNTQVSLDYSAWRQGLKIHALRGSRHHNPYATHDHRDHKRRRQPYDTAVRTS